MSGADFTTTQAGLNAIPSRQGKLNYLADRIDEVEQENKRDNFVFARTFISKIIARVYELEVRLQKMEIELYNYQVGKSVNITVGDAPERLTVDIEEFTEDIPQEWLDLLDDYNNYILDDARAIHI